MGVDITHAIDGMPRVDGWAPAPKTLGEVLADEIYRLTLGREVEPIVLTVREKERFESVVQLWLEMKHG